MGLLHSPAGAAGLRPGRRGPEAPRPLRPQPAGPVDVAGPPAGRGGRAVRHRLRRPAQRPARQLGLALRQLPAAQGRPAAAGRPRFRGLDRRPDRARACSTRRWSSPWASSAGRPRSTAAAGRDHWPNATASVLAGGGVRGGMAYRRQRQARRLPRRRTASPPPTSPPPSSGGWASTPPARSTTSPAAPTSSPTAGRSGRCSGDRRIAS